jgi:hypothetical protein
LKVGGKASILPRGSLRARDVRPAIQASTCAFRTALPPGHNARPSQPFVERAGILPATVLASHRSPRSASECSAHAEEEAHSFRSCEPGRESLRCPRGVLSGELRWSCPMNSTEGLTDRTQAQRPHPSGRTTSADYALCRPTGSMPSLVDT